MNYSNGHYNKISLVELMALQSIKDNYMQVELNHLSVSIYIVRELKIYIENDSNRINYQNCNKSFHSCMRIFFSSSVNNEKYLFF